MKNKLPNLNKRIIAAALSASLLGFSATSYSKSENNKAKNFVKEHPIVTSAAVMVGAGALIAGSIKLKEVVGTLLVSTPVNEIPDERIHEYLNNQLDKFNDYGRQYGGKYGWSDKWLFTVNPEMSLEADPRVLALVVSSINKTFERVPFLAEVLKTKLVQHNSTLCIDWSDDKQNEAFCRLNSSSFIISGLPIQFKINKNHICSLYKTKKLMKKDSLAVQKQVVAELGNFFNDLVAERHRLNLFSMGKQAKNRDENFNESEFYLKFNYQPFGALLADYVFQTRSDEDVLMKLFKEHLDSLEKNWRNDKSMFNRR